MIPSLPLFGADENEHERVLAESNRIKTNKGLPFESLYLPKIIHLWMAKKGDQKSF
jgi:hypothetical protein